MEGKGNRLFASAEAAGVDEKRRGRRLREKKAGPLKEIRKRMPFSLSLVWVKALRPRVALLTAGKLWGLLPF